MLGLVWRMMSSLLNRDARKGSVKGERQSCALDENYVQNV
jgi:hypothetical protein